MIDRKELVQRHNPANHKVNKLSPLTVGNGNFAFTADITGLQTFANLYKKEIPLCTMSQWGWHTFPCPGKLKGKELVSEEFGTGSRKVGYRTSRSGQEELFNYLRENPHRLHLGKIGFSIIDSKGQEVTVEQITNIEQELDLWSGVLTSSFSVEDYPVEVLTACHPRQDILACKVKSPLLAEKRLKIVLDFPYAATEKNAADWESPLKHKTGIIDIKDNRYFEIMRSLDETVYFSNIQFKAQQLVKKAAPHQLVFAPREPRGKLEFSCLFASEKQRSSSLPESDLVFSESKNYRKKFWQQGAALDFSATADERARELERRIILSQYLTSIQCSGILPPQETGLTCNSWYGKFHLEMHPWHAAQFVFWGRKELLENSLWWYHSILDRAKKLAAAQGYRGARWPKMVGPAGEDSPSSIGPLILWQQPHPIALCELIYRACPRQAVLEKYGELVLASAEFMASFVDYDREKGHFILPPPIAPLQENYQFKEVLNPIFETEYWVQGLETAQKWCSRLGLERKETWQQIIENMAPLPHNGEVYLGHERAPDTFENFNSDHPSPLMLNILPPSPGINGKIMANTLDKVLEDWQWETAWGWDFPVVALSAARLGRREQAVDCLLMDADKNTYLPNGHNWQNSELPVYLPGNGALLTVVAIMAAGWRGVPDDIETPGFPSDWEIGCEGLHQFLY